MGATSAGSIQLDLEVNAKLEESTKKEAEKIVKAVKEQLGSMKENMFISLGKSVENAMKAMTEAVRKQTDASKKIMQSFIKDLQKMIAEMKLVTPKMPYIADEAAASNSATAIPTMTRAPPAPSVSIPRPKIKLDEQFETEMMEQKISELTNSLELLDNKIQALQANRKSLLSESLKAEATGDANIIKSLDEQVMKLDAQIAALQDSSARTSITLDALARKRTVNLNLKPLTNDATSSNSILTNLKNTISQLVTKSKELASNILKVGTSAKSAGRNVSRSHMSFKRFMQSMVLFSLLMPAITRSIRSMGKSLLDSLNTNRQFADSLTMIKSNLSVAFTPIFEAILPAINALMSGLSTLTAYIAGFISAIFGKTLKQSVDSTKSLVAAKNAMGAYGNATKQAAKEARGLLAIDELNILQEKEASGSSGNTPEINIPTIDVTAVDEQMGSLATRIKGIFDDMFAPLFKAWNNGGLGDKIIKRIKNSFSNIGYVLNGIGEVLGKVWGKEGVAVCTSFLNIVDSILSVIETLTESMRYVWDNGGAYAFEQLLTFGAKLFELASYIFTNFVTPFINWFIELISPAIAQVIEWVGWLLEQFNSLIDWLLTDGQPVLDTIIVVLGSLALAVAAVTAATSLYSGALAVAKIAGKTFRGVMSSITSPIGMVTLAIAAVIAIGYLLIENWDTVCEVAQNVWNKITGYFRKFDDFLTGIFTKDWSESFSFIGDLLNGFFASCKSIWDDIKLIFQGIIDFIAGVFTGDWERAWTGIQEFFGGIMNSLVDIAKIPINLVIGLINGLFDGINWIIRKVNTINVDIPLIGHVGFDLPEIPKINALAKGGIVDAPTLAMVGEAGKEAVMPLENNTGWIDDLAGKIYAHGNGSTQMEVLEVLYKLLDRIDNLKLVLEIDQKELGQVIFDYLDNYSKANGSLPIPI